MDAKKIMIFINKSLFRTVFCINILSVQTVSQLLSNQTHHWK